MAEKSSGSTAILSGVMEGRLKAVEDRQATLDREFSAYRSDQAEFRLTESKEREKETKATSNKQLYLGLALAASIFAAGVSWNAVRSRVASTEMQVAALNRATDALLEQQADFFVPAIEALSDNQKALGSDVGWLVKVQKERLAAVREAREERDIEPPALPLRTLPAKLK